MRCVQGHTTTTTTTTTTPPILKTTTTTTTTTTTIMPVSAAVLVVVAVTLLAQGSLAIRITDVVVPSTVEVGGGAELDCKWAEDTDRMYSIKWYQAADEFYRYTPTAAESVQIFDLPTLDVDREKSWGGSVRIANVTLAAAGPFHCEVSADAPTFYTASLSSTLTVVDLPDGGPVVTGVRSSYVPGDWVDLICSTRRSRPPPILTYTLNNKPAPAGWLEPQVNQEDEEGLITSTLRLRFSLQRHLLEYGEVQVACVAEIPNVYREEARDVLSTRPPYQASVLGAAPEGTSRRHWHAALPLLLLLAHPHL